MEFGIQTLDDYQVAGKTVLCRVDINQPVDRETGTLRSTVRIRACVPTLRELSDKGARVVILAHQGSDIEYKNYYTTRPHAAVLTELLGRPVRFVDDVCGPAAREAIRSLQDGELLLLDNVRFMAEEQTLFETNLRPTPRWWRSWRRWATCTCATPLPPPTGTSPPCAASSRCCPPPWAGCSSGSTPSSPN